MMAAARLTGSVFAASLLAWGSSVWADNGGASMMGPTGFAEQNGEQLYRMICQGCHMADAKGAEGAGRYPALVSNPHLAGAAYVMHVVLKGQKGMPGFADNLSDQQISDVVNYVRSHFGNHYSGAVTPAEVQAARGK